MFAVRRIAQRSVHRASCSRPAHQSRQFSLTRSVQEEVREITRCLTKFYVSLSTAVATADKAL